MFINVLLFLWNRRFSEVLFLHYGSVCPLRFILDSINGKKNNEVWYFPFAKILAKMCLKFLNPTLTRMRGSRLSHTVGVSVTCWKGDLVLVPINWNFKKSHVFLWSPLCQRDSVRFERGHYRPRWEQEGIGWKDEDGELPPNRGTLCQAADHKKPQHRQEQGGREREEMGSNILS